LYGYSDIGNGTVQDTYGYPDIGPKILLEKNGSPDTGSNGEAAGSTSKAIGEGTNRPLFFIKESAFFKSVFFAIVNSKSTSFP